MAARAPRLGRALQAIGLVVMPVAVLWGWSTDQVGMELLLGFGVGFALIMIGRSLSSG
jgi:hypothetical protein